MDNWTSVYKKLKNTENTKQHDNTIHRSTKMTPIEAFKKMKEETIFSNLQVKKQKRKSEYDLRDSVRTDDFKKLLCNFDTTIWSNKLYTIPHIIHDLATSNRINYRP